MSVYLKSYRNVPRKSEAVDKIIDGPEGNKGVVAHPSGANYNHDVDSEDGREEQRAPRRIESLAELEKGNYVILQLLLSLNPA